MIEYPGRSNRVAGLGVYETALDLIYNTESIWFDFSSFTEKVTMKIIKFITLLLASNFFLASSFAAEHVVNAQARIFKPDIVYIELGDNVNFNNMTSHNAVSYIKPEGSAGFGEKGHMPGGSLKILPEKEGIYGYVCEPHIGFGMIGVIVVGNVTQEMKDAALKQADETLEGPFRRLLGTIKKVKVQ